MGFAEQLKSQLNIVDVIGQYVRLKRSGRGPAYIGLCPFHSEKTPSFNVHSANQFYKCFGCDAGGDVFKFVMEIESLTFPETLKLLAERYGIPMPERNPADDAEGQRSAALLEMHEIAADLFQANLRSAAGAAAREYLDSRGVSAGTASEFRLGLSETSGQQLVSRLQKFGPGLMEASGLAAKRETGGFYDRFRGRLMFPIHSESGKIVAFGGRALRSGDEPKYLNSPETSIYKKSKILYNLHRAKIAGRKSDRMILVEGYMDVIGVYAAGIHEVVAACGTSLSIDQVRSIKRQVAPQQASAGQVVLNFDSDAAGARAAEKYISALLAEGLRVRVLEVPGGLDPDEYIQQQGAAAYGILVDEARSYFPWLAERAQQKFDMRSMEGRVDAFRSILPAVQQVSDRLERAAIAREVADLLRVDRAVVAEALRPPPRAIAPQRPAVISAAIPPNEKLLLACLLASGEARAAINHYLRNSRILHLLDLRPIFEASLAIDAGGTVFSFEALNGRLEARDQNLVAGMSFADLGVQEENAAEQALHCLRALEKKSMSAACDDLRGRIRELEAHGDFAGALRLADQLDRLKRISSEA
ncbi:MAG: DNA primase [Bryobacteraceae bacterium]